MALEIPPIQKGESVLAYWGRLRTAFGWSDTAGILAATAAGLAASDRNEETNRQILAELRFVSLKLRSILPDPPAEKTDP